MKTDERGKRHLSWEPWWAFSASVVGFVTLIQFSPAASISDELTRGHRWKYLWLLAAVLVVIALVSVYLKRRGDKEYDAFPLNRFLALSAPLIVICGLLFVSIFEYPDARDWGKNLVGNYCAWGAANNRQFEGCVNHVTLEQVERLNTPAAKFAKDSESRCGEARGVYCPLVEAGYDEAIGP